MRVQPGIPALWSGVAIAVELLRSLHWTPQKPNRRARERHEERIQGRIRTVFQRASNNARRLKVVGHVEVELGCVECIVEARHEGENSVEG